MLQNDISFKKLGLLIVDEEQRYEDMEEQVKWYQKEMGFNLNPFSRRKNGKK